jgi:hypothetical protein
MTFRSTLFVSNAVSSTEVPIVVRFPGPPWPVAVTIGKDNRPATPRGLRIVGTAEIEPNDAWGETLWSLQEGRLPASSKPCETGSGRIEPGETLDGYVPPLDVFPDAFRSFTTGVSAHLHDTMRRAWRLTRWRFDLDLPLGALSGGPFEWSRDGVTWIVVPRQGSAIARVDRSLPGRPGASAELQTLADASVVAPLSRDLFHESENVGFANGRSALVIVIAALEVGVKECISDLVPNAEWLATNVPSPPVVKMLTDYLPTLPVRASFPVGVVPPPPGRPWDSTRLVASGAVTEPPSAPDRGSTTLGRAPAGGTISRTHSQ